MVMEKKSKDFKFRKYNKFSVIFIQQVWTFKCVRNYALDYSIFIFVLILIFSYQDYKKDEIILKKHPNEAICWNIHCVCSCSMKNEGNFQLCVSFSVQQVEYNSRRSHQTRLYEDVWYSSICKNYYFYPPGYDITRTVFWYCT